MPLTLRLPDDLHRLAAIAAASRRQSLHAWLVGAVRSQLLRDARTKEGVALAAALDAEEGRTS